MRNFESLPDPQDGPKTTVPRVGERFVQHVIDGTTFRHAMNPGEFRCETLATQLIDEWESRYRQAPPTRFGGQQYRQSIRSFVGYVDSTSTPAQEIRLDENPERFLHAFYEWESFRVSNLPNSELGSRDASRILILIRQRASRGLFVCDDILQRCESGSSFGRPRKQHLEEFPRDELKGFLQQARISIRADKARLSKYRELASVSWPDETKPGALVNLLRSAISNEISTAGLPSIIPTEVHRCASELGINTQRAGTRTSLNIMNVMQRMMFASERELLPPVLMLIYKTGLTYDEIKSIRLSSVIDEGSQIAVRCVKRRAKTEAVHRFAVTSQDRGSPWSVFGLIEHLRWLTQPAREEASGEQKDLLLMAHYVSNGRRYVKHATHRKYRLSHWFEDNELAYSRPANWNRLRKSHHTVRALNSSDPRAARSDHSSEVFERHYLSTRAVLQKSGKSYIDSAEQAFSDATKGPEVEAAWADSKEPQRLGPLHRRAWEEARNETSSDRATTVGKCADMKNSPFSSRGICNDQVRLCMICPNALILKDHLPQVVILSDHLEKLRKLSDPQRFQEQYWQIRSSIEDVLSRFSEGDIAAARDSIEAGYDSLCIPASMRVAF